MRLRVLSGENFSCHSCTNCCRGWHVELLPEEIQQIENLNWPANDPLTGRPPLLRHAGKVFLAHNADGSCMFLNSTTQRCRIHEQFGADAKPLGCRLFPFQITPTFAGEATVMGRYDCPSIRKNSGLSHADELPSLRRYANRILEGEAFSEATLCHLDQDQVQAVCEFVATMLPGFADDRRRALFIVIFCDWLSGVLVSELDRMSLAREFSQVKTAVEQVAARPDTRGPGLFQRFAFRALLGMYLRRDEDVLDQRAGRLGRLVSMTTFVSGFGSFKSLGLVHHSGSLRKARLFELLSQAHPPDTFALFWRMIQNKLESLQFMGSAGDGRNFIEGLRALSLLYPLTAAVAKYNARNRGAAFIEADDVDDAVGAIEHSFGRSAILRQPTSRTLERFLLEGETFLRLLHSI